MGIARKLKQAIGGFGLGELSGGDAAWQAALATARQPADDAEAAAALRAELGARGTDEKERADALRRGSDADTYLSDRARRLMEAVITGEPVQPASGPHAELFDREAALGRLPLGEAYSVLVGFQPPLGDLQAGVERETKTASAGAEPSRLGAIRRDAKRLAGPRANHDDELVKSNLALDVTQRYLYALTGYTALGDLETPYFQSPNEISTMPLGS